VGNNDSEVSTGGNNGLAIGFADNSSKVGAITFNGRVAVSAAVQNSFAGSDGDGLMALAAAAGASNASAPHVGAPACTGPGIAIAARSDGAFCIDVGGMVASG
jgi:hypothetical protein